MSISLQPRGEIWLSKTKIGRLRQTETATADPWKLDLPTTSEIKTVTRNKNLHALPDK